MKTRNLIVMIFALGWLLGMTACEKDESGINEDKDVKVAKTRVVLDSPLDNLLDSAKVKIQDVPGKFDFTRYIKLTFSWHIENPKSGVTYNSTLLFYGERYVDGETYNVVGYVVGSKTEYTMVLSRSWRWDGLIKWTVKAEDTNGQIYESVLHSVNILPQSNLKVILDGPPNNAMLVEGDITFCWHLENAKEGVTYNYAILFDKGVNPFDGYYETHADVGEATEYTKYMSASWWGSFDWGVAVEGSDGVVCHSKARTVKDIIKKQ